MQAIFHADDFGMNPFVTDGIVRAIRHGRITATSIFANAPDTRRALGLWTNESPRADLGVHLNLTQGEPLTGMRFPAELLDADGRFLSVERLFPKLLLRGDEFIEGVRRELSMQIAAVIDQGVQPTHVNGHQYIEIMPGVRDAFPTLLDEFDIPAMRVPLESGLWRSSAHGGRRMIRFTLGRVKHHFAQRFARMASDWPATHADAFFGSIHAGKIDGAALRSFLSTAFEWSDNARPTPRVIEIGWHPSEPIEGVPFDAPPGWQDPIAMDRPRELTTLLSDETDDLLRAHDMTLVSYSDLREKTPAPIADAA